MLDAASPSDRPLNWRWPDVTVGDYDRMLERQGGGCAICGARPKTKRLQLDHDHKTKRLRGLLCFTCNRHILGKYATAKKLRAAADYLDAHA